MVRIVMLAIVVAVGILILVGTGWVGFLVYAFLVGVAAIAMWGLGLGGRVTRDLSRGRFAHRDR